MNMEFDVVIVANGEFPTHPVPLDILNSANHIVACDGAIMQLSTLLMEGDRDIIVIGDGDSVPDMYRHLLIQVDEQEDNDLTKATRYCIEQGWQRIAYIGCTGRREDHTLGNIALLMRYYQSMQVEAMMFTDQGFFTPAKGDTSFTSHKGQQVSIFNFGCSRLESTQLKWSSYAYQEWWQGTLNEALSSCFSLHGDSAYLVFQTYR